VDDIAARGIVMQNEKNRDESVPEERRSGGSPQAERSSRRATYAP
jgi:hypothetical protein